MALFGGIFGGRGKKRMLRDAEKIRDHLRTLDDESIGLVLAIAAHQRNALIKEGNNLRDLSSLAESRPDYDKDLADAVNVLVRNKRPHDALGLQIWLQSFRGVLVPEITPFAQDIWRELERGRPHIAKAKELVRDEAEFELDVTFAGEVPPEYAANE